MQNSFIGRENKIYEATSTSGEQEQAILITRDMLEKEDPRTDFEKGISYLPFLIMMLIAANVGIFLAELSRGALESQEAIIAAGALSREHVLAGEAWRLLSATFLHGSFMHILGNCIVLYIVGMACEHAMGSGKVFIVYLFSGLCGSLLSFSMSAGPSVGASGAIFGVIGSVIVFMYRYKDSFYVRDNRIGFVLAVWAVYTIGQGFFTPYIDNFAHIGGFLGGMLITFFLKPRLLSLPRPEEGRA